ncbi:YDG domain-containing protein [Acetobacterium woodii]|uniref:S-layer domain containing protein n=1 Tax=Acetobacterium woodii (strain ATCC 29683 / DSM 1030 / JCM 2381 / KCTC 1655 / WB1) TaxID=931626 RepID=H6LEZ3_ACEWD|nr:YDG domain-containing protein [Acetobacterium woodii]AFA46899.1 S-layer domain containing protein [Acetobacterium woodii DSM 1030]
MKKLIFALFLFCLISPIHAVVAAPVDNTLTVLSRGHIQDLGDFPQDGSWVESPERIGTVGQSKRIEGFEIKPGINLPSDIQIYYNVHVQNRGWLYDEENPTTWAKNGEYAGTRGESLRIEAIKIVILDASGNKATGYHIYYQGHVQNVGDLPADSEKWIKDGETLGTVGSSLRLEALKLEIIRDTSNDVDLSAYNGLTKKIESFNEADYTKESWAKLQMAIKQNVVTGKNTQKEVDAAVKMVETAIAQLENLTTSTVYDKAGTYGPASGMETINQDVIITSRDVTLQNLKVEGDLIIDEAVGDGNVTLNNINVSGELRVRGGGQNSIHINGGDYSKILVEQAPDGGVRIVATNLQGVPVVLSEDAAGETLILEGSFDSVTVSAPDVVIKTQGQTSIKTFDVDAIAQNAAINLGANTQVTNLSLSAPAQVTGTGTVDKAEIASDNVSFEKAPVYYDVDPKVAVPPVIPTPQPEPTPQPGGGYTPPSKITLSVNANSLPAIAPKTYDGTTAVYDSANVKISAYPIDAAGITGIVSGDDVSVLATANYNNKNAGTDKTVTYTYSLSGAQADKYSLSGTTKIENCIITQKQLSQPPIPTVTKVFDGSTTQDTTLTDNIGQVATDALTITQTATYQNSPGSTKDAIEVGNGKKVNCTYQLSGADASNYMAPTAQTGTGSVTPKILNFSWANNFKEKYGEVAKNKSYDGNTKVLDGKGNYISVTTSVNFDTGVAGDTAIVVTAVASYDNKNAGSDKTITITYIIAGSDSSSRYQIAPETINQASIAKRQMTVAEANVPKPMAKIYDGTTVVFDNTSPISNKVVTPDNAISADKVTLVANASYVNADAEVNKPVTISYKLTEGAENYLPPKNTTAAATITPLALNTKVIPTLAKEYDGTSAATVNLAFTASDPTIVELIKQNQIRLDVTSAVYKGSNGAEISAVGSGYTITYAYKLSGDNARNFALVGAETSGVISGMVKDGSIIPKTLTITPPSIKTFRDYDGTSNVYDTSGNSIASSYPIEPAQITGVADQDSIAVIANMTGAGKDAGTQQITITYSWLNSADANYLLPTPQLITVTINPLPLTVAANNVPAVDATKKYDGTTATNVINKSVAVSGVLSDDTTKVSATATATYTDKSVGSAKAITIIYSLTGDAAKNYQVPAEDTTKKAAITPRILGYSNIVLNTVKKADKTSEVNVVSAEVDPTKATSGTDGVVYNSGDEDKLTLSCSANYYDGDNKTSTIGSHPIILSGTLSGDEAGNYVMIDNYTYGNGEILADNAVITATYNGIWSSWSSAGAILTPPTGVSNFTLFYKDSSNYYGMGSDGKIYQATNLTNWSQYTSSSVVGSDNLSTSNHLIGIDANGNPLAIDAGGKLYIWVNGWGVDGTVPNVSNPINPTYYSDGSNQYLIYQDAVGMVYQTNLAYGSPASIANQPIPTLLTGFSHTLLVYNGTAPTIYAY